MWSLAAFLAMGMWLEAMFGLRVSGVLDDPLRREFLRLGHAHGGLLALVNVGLAWALERLSRHPAVLQRAVRAAEDGDDDYLDAVAKETLRNRPVVFDVGRILTEPVELAGHRLPAGVMVVPGLIAVHADP